MMMELRESNTYSDDIPEPFSKMRFWYHLGYQLPRSLVSAFCGYRVIGQENLVDEAPILYVCNHESYLDPPLIGQAFNHELDYLARKTLFKGIGKFLYPRFNAVPIDQDNPELKTLRLMINRLKNKGQVLIFPEGERTYDGKLGKGQQGVGMIVAKSWPTVQPMRLFGAREILPRGKTFIKPHPVRLVIGKPIVWNEAVKQAKGKEQYNLISEQIMQEIGKLSVDGYVCS